MIEATGYRLFGRVGSDPHRFHPCSWRNIAITLTDPVSGEQTAQACVNAWFHQ